MAQFTNFCLEWFMTICISLCFLSAMISSNKKVSFTILISICLFKTIYLLDFLIFKNSSYYLLAVVIDTFTFVFCYKYKSSTFVLILLASAVLFNAISFFLYELSTRHLFVWEFYSKFIYIYYESTMKMIIMLLVLYNFKDGLLNGIFERKYNINNRCSHNSNIFYPYWVDVKRAIR